MGVKRRSRTRNGSDAGDDPLRGFELYDEDIHKVLDFQQGIRETSDRIECLVESEKRSTPECLSAKGIVEKILNGILFSDCFKD